MHAKRTCLRGLLTALLIGAAGPAGLAHAAAGMDLRLVEAVANKNMAVVPFLLREGVDPSLPQADGTTALHWAVHWDDLETADLLLLFGADANATNDYGATPLALACTNGNAAMVEKLLAARANANAATALGETPLMRCARSGSVDAVKALLARGANPNATENEQGQTALMWAVSQKHPAVAKALIEAGADIHARSRGGFTPLLFAARVGDAESAALLIEAGANVNEAGPKGMTPLLMASASGQEEVGILFLEKGADPNAKDENGATALHYTVMKGITALNGVRAANYVSYLFRPSLEKLAQALLDRGADPNAQLEKAPPLGGSGSPIAAGATPFLLAAASPDVNMMRMLVAAGANPNIATKANLTPLMVAAGLSRGQDFTEDEKRISLEAVKLAIELGADVNAASDTGLTALHGAAVNGADAVVQLLAEHGANLDARDQYQQTPLSIASGERLPWIPYGDELGEIIQPSTRDLLLKLGATPLDTPGYFKEPTEFTEAYRINQAQRYGGAPAAPAPAPQR